MIPSVERAGSYGDAVLALRAAQKTSKGAPAYSRFVNRPLGRRFAALAHLAGATPNQVTLVSALFTFAGLGLVAWARPSPASSLLVALLLALGYGLDAADGQLARLRGGGSAAGEWLDHVVDALKQSSVHLLVLVCWYRFYDLDPLWLLLPIAFQIVDSTQFFALILTDQLRRMHREDRGTIRAGQGRSSLLYSLAVVPTDYGLMCLIFGLLWWQPVFVAAYGLMFIANAAFLALALPKWFREVKRLGQ